MRTTTAPRGHSMASGPKPTFPPRAHAPALSRLGLCQPCPDSCHARVLHHSPGQALAHQGRLCHLAHAGKHCDGTEQHWGKLWRKDTPFVCLHSRGTSALSEWQEPLGAALPWPCLTQGPASRSLQKHNPVTLHVTLKNSFVANRVNPNQHHAYR